MSIVYRSISVLSYLLVILTSMSLPAAASLIDFSPDGKQVAYGWQDAAISPVDGGAVAIVPNSHDPQFVRWSPTGRHLAVVTRGAQSELKLYNVAAKTTRGIGGNLRAPFAWREDGNRFACIHDLADGRVEMVWYNLAENGVSFRTTLPFKVDSEAPMVWLPTTDDLALVAADHNVYTIESGEVKKVTTSGDVLGMNLYAGGKKLVWARRGPNLHYILMSVYAYDLTARNVVRLGFPDRVPALNPNPRTAPDSVDRVVFAPAGENLLLYVTQSSTKGRSTALYEVSMDGRLARQLQRVTGAASAVETVQSTWSRDGSAIAVLATADGSRKLFTMAADGSGGHVIRSDARP